MTVSKYQGYTLFLFLPGTTKLRRILIGCDLYLESLKIHNGLYYCREGDGNQQNPNQTVQLFNENVEMSIELVTKFRESSSAKNKERQVENPVRTEGIEVTDLGHVAINHTLGML